MRVLGIDPGTAALGYGIVERTKGALRSVDWGCFETGPELTLPDRLLRIHRLIADLIDLHRPDIVAVERLFFSRNVQTAFAVGQARGVVLLSAAQREVPVREATPNEVKSAVAGYGSADKEQVARMVRIVLGMSEVPAPDDAADALATAICVANRERSGTTAGAALLDRSAVAALDGYESAFDRAVRDALAREAGTVAARRRRRAS